MQEGGHQETSVWIHQVSQRVLSRIIINYLLHLPRRSAQTTTSTCGLHDEAVWTPTLINWAVKKKNCSEFIVGRAFLLRALIVSSKGGDNQTDPPPSYLTRHTHRNRTGTRPSNISAPNWILKLAKQNKTTRNLNLNVSYILYCKPQQVYPDKMFLFPETWWDFCVSWVLLDISLNTLPHPYVNKESHAQVEKSLLLPHKYVIPKTTTHFKLIFVFLVQVLVKPTQIY